MKKNYFIVDVLGIPRFVPEYVFIEFTEDLNLICPDYLYIHRCGQDLYIDCHNNTVVCGAYYD